MTPARPVAARLRVASRLPPRGGTNSIGIDADAAPPAWLDRIAKAEWRRVVRAAAAARPVWLQECDVAALTAYCAGWSLYRRAAEDVAQRGHLLPGRSSADRARGEAGMVANPSVRIARDAAVELRRWVVQLGFSPDARAKVDTGPTEVPDRFGDLFD